MRRFAVTLAALGALTALSAGCTSPAPSPSEPRVPVRPSPTPSAPTIRAREYSIDNGVFKLSATVNPGLLPTTVVLEYATAPGSPPVFDKSALVEQPVTAAGLVLVELTLSADAHPCFRWTATNSAGTASTEALCIQPPNLPQRSTP